MRAMQEVQIMMPISYTQLNHPLAQIDAAEEFCGQIAAHVADSWYEHAQKEYGKTPPNVEEVHVANVLDTLATLGMRFELSGTLTPEDDGIGDGYFAFEFKGSHKDHVLHMWAL